MTLARAVPAWKPVHTTERTTRREFRRLDERLERERATTPATSVENRWGDVVDVDALGFCLDCGYAPEECSPDEHR